jgi:hypothetical protein
MATVLEGCTTEEQRFGAGQKDSMQRINKYLLFTVGRICRVMRFNIGSKRYADDEEVETDVEVTETTVKRLLFCIGKATAQFYQCWWRICREINVFSQVRTSHVFTFYIHLWPIS